MQVNLPGKAPARAARRSVPGRQELMVKKYLPQLLSLFLFLFLTSAFLPAGVLLGDQNVESTLDSNAAGRAQAFPTTASASGLLSSLSMYVDPTSTASQIAIGLYSDAGGHPSSLLTQAVFTPQAGVWNTASVPPVAVSLGTPYWIAVLGLGSGRPYFRDSVTGCTSEGSSSDSLAALPAAWSTGGIWTACALSAYGSASGNGWSVVYVDSQETSCYNGAAANAIDGNPSTMWHTQFCGAAPPTPHEIQINLGGSYNLTAFQYLPRQDGSACGWIGQYEFYVSADGVNWGTAVATGTFDYGTLSTQCPGPGAGVPGPLQIPFPQTTGQYIRLRALSEINGNPWTSAAEITVLGAPLAGPAALAAVSLNPATVVGGGSSGGTVTLNSPAPAGGAVVALSSSNLSVASAPASVSVPAGSSTATFTVATTAVVSPTQVMIGGSYNGSQSAILTVNPGSLIPQTNWSVAYVDSQETSCYNGAATNAIDGNPSTFWHTQFCGAAPPTPHEIQINLGGSYNLTAFQYLPRQDGSACGWIGQYEFYVSADGVNWGTAVATGTFNYGNLSTQCPGPGAGVPGPLQIAFPQTTGQYIRLRALSEINGNPYTSAAEINVLGITVTAPGVAVAVSPVTVSLTTGGTQQFTATVTGTSNMAVTWSASGGSISSSGLYTAPATAGTYTVTATSAADITKSASATVTVSAPVLAVSVSPASLSINVGGTQQFTATVTGTSNTAVIWSATGGGISPSGLFTAPAIVGIYTVTATSAADTTKSASATVIVVALVTHSATLSWTASTSSVVGYNVYRATQSGGPYTMINTAPQPGTSYADLSVQAGQTYYYVLTAVDSSGTESVNSNEVTAVVPSP